MRKCYNQIDNIPHYLSKILKFVEMRGVAIGRDKSLSV